MDAPRYETWAGAEVSTASWAIWSGLAFAPLGSVRADGVQLRIIAGGGQFRYRAHHLVDGRPAPATFTASTTFIDAYLGYQARIGAWTTKPFVGFGMQERWVLPASTGHNVSGSEAGLKLALDNWLDLSPSLWASLDGSWTLVNNSYWSRARLGWRAINDLSIGLEAGALGQIAHETTRAGLFLRFAWPSGEASVSGGLSLEPADARQGYAGASVLARF